MYELFYFHIDLGKVIVGSFQSEEICHAKAEELLLEEYNIAWYIYTNFQPELIRIEHFSILEE